MIDSLSKRQRQWLALAILAMVVITLVLLTISPLWALNRHYRHTIDDLHNRLALLQRGAAAIDGLQSQHEQLQRLMDDNPDYLQSESETLATAELQSIIKRLAVPRGMHVLSTQTLRASEEQDVVRIALKVRMRGTLDGLVPVFFALETGQPYLFLDKVSIRTPGQRRTISNKPQQLDINFDLISYLHRRP